MDLMRQIELENLKSNAPDFGVGDTVDVDYLIREGEKERVQVFSGVVIAPPLVKVDGSWRQPADVAWEIAETSDGVVRCEVDWGALDVEAIEVQAASPTRGSTPRCSRTSTRTSPRLRAPGCRSCARSCSRTPTTRAPTPSRTRTRLSLIHI